MMRKIVLFDIDGTLLECINGKTQLSQITKQALMKLKENGYYIMIASGRPYCYLPKEIRDFDFDGYILDDGAHVIFNQHEWLHPIAEDKLKPLFQQALEKEMTVVGYAEKYAYAYHDDGSLLQYARTFMLDESLVKYVDTISELNKPFLKLHIQCRNELDFQQFILNDQDFYCANDTQHYLKEIYSRQYTKATAFNEILTKLNIARENSYFFGDGFNDIQMMDAVGHAIAMANAHDDVKKHADYVCQSVLEDGVAQFILHSNIFFKEKG